jgi:hypothetical protein
MENKGQEVELSTYIRRTEDLAWEPLVASPKF